MAPSMDWAEACGRPTSSAHTGWRPRCAAAWCGSTATSGSIQDRPSADLASPVMDAKWVSRRCTTTPRRNPSGSMSMQKFRLGTRASSSDKSRCQDHEHEGHEGHEGMRRDTKEGKNGSERGTENSAAPIQAIGQAGCDQEFARIFDLLRADSVFPSCPSCS